MAGAEASSRAPAGPGRGFAIGGYTFEPRGNPIHYLVLWGLTTLVCLALAAPLPGLAVAFAAAMLFGTLMWGSGR